jgi:hypothetical protein
MRISANTEFFRNLLNPVESEIKHDFTRNFIEMSDLESKTKNCEEILNKDYDSMKTKYQKLKQIIAKSTKTNKAILKNTRDHLRSTFGADIVGHSRNPSES